MTSTNAPRSHALLPLAHESMRKFIPGIEQAARRFAQAARESPSFGEAATVPGPRMIELEGMKQFLSDYVELTLGTGAPRESVTHNAEFLAAHLHYAMNFELHRKKVFWVDEALAWMLRFTNLDIEGRALNLPFQSFALVFQDEPTLDMMHALRHRSVPPPRILTVYVTRTERSEAGGCVADIDLTFVGDPCAAGEWPYLFNRNICVRPDDDLTTILHSHPSWIRADPVVAAEHAENLQSLVHLAINAVLYSTSAAPDAWQLMSSPVKALEAKARGLGKKRQRRAATRAADLRRTHSSESVLLLPGKISISRLRALRELERTDTGGQLFSRFMVRGHWRRPSAAWNDKRLRWIAPYWKGPDIATIVEREYRMTT